MLNHITHTMRMVNLQVQNPAVLLFCIGFFCACSGNMDQFNVINLEHPEQEEIINLSDLLDNIRIVKLETSEDILLGENTNYLVGNKYIVTLDNEKILQFSADGRHIRTLASAGHGPDEFVRINAFALDDDNDLLYIYHRGDYNHISSYNLTNGERIGRIPTGIDNLISQIVVCEDTILAIVPRLNSQYNLYYLSTSGYIIDGISPPVTKNIGMDCWIDNVSDHLYFMPKEYDTIYEMQHDVKNPYCYFSMDDRFSIENNETGSFIYLSANTSGYMIVNRVHANILLNNDGETFSMNADEITSYLIDKKDFSVTKIRGYYNDFLRFEEPFNPWSNYIYERNDMAFRCYQSYALKQLVEEAIEAGKANEEIMNRLLTHNNLNENENPVLLIGNARKQ